MKCAIDGVRVVVNSGETYDLYVSAIYTHQGKKGAHSVG